MLVQTSEGKLNIEAKPRNVPESANYVNVYREITTVLKIAVENVVLKLCDLCDFFAYPLLIEKKIKFNLEF